MKYTLINLTKLLIELPRIQKQIIQIFSDLIIIFLCVYFSIILHYLEPNQIGYSIKQVQNVDLFIFLLISLCTILFNFIIGLYKNIIRFSGWYVIFLTISSSLFSSILFALILYLFVSLISPQVFVIYCLSLLISFISVRFLARSIFQINKLKIPKAIIYGAKEDGRILLEILNKQNHYGPIAFIDDTEELIGSIINGIRVFHSSDIEKVINKYRAEILIFSSSEISQFKKEIIFEILNKYKIEIRTIPNINDLVAGRKDSSHINIVSIDELLGRKAVPPITSLIKANITRKNVFVSGAGGSIGSEICKQVIQYAPKSIFLFDISEFALYKVEKEINELITNIETEYTSKTKVFAILGSITDGNLLDEIFHSYNIDTVYHAAAYKHVPIVEENIISSINNNIFGTFKLLDYVIKNKIENFTFVSSDKAVRPTNIMGATKRIAELLCNLKSKEKNNTKISIVRFGNVLGSSGSVIPLFKEQIDKGGPVTITDRSITRYFMTISESAQLVIQAGALAKGGEVFVLDMGKPMKITELAYKMIQLHGLKPYTLENGNKSDPDGDIEVSFTKLRVGEKLYEELFTDSNIFKTRHPRIMCSHEMEIDKNLMINLLEELNKQCKLRKLNKILDLLYKFPIDYKPNTET